MIFKEKQNKILSVTVKVLNNYDNYKLKDMYKGIKKHEVCSKSMERNRGRQSSQL